MDLVVQGERHVANQGEHERRDRQPDALAARDRRQQREPADQLAVLGQIEPDFFAGLADRRVKQAGIARIAPPPRQRHVARPGVGIVRGPANQQHLGALFALAQHRRHRRQTLVSVGVRRRFVVAAERAANQAEVDVRASGGAHGR